MDSSSCRRKARHPCHLLYLSATTAVFERFSLDLILARRSFTPSSNSCWPSKNPTTSTHRYAYQSPILHATTNQDGRLTKAPDPFASNIHILAAALLFPLHLSHSLFDRLRLVTQVSSSSSSRTCFVSYLGQHQLRLLPRADSIHSRDS
jgi:hypothetical protein